MATDLTDVYQCYDLINELKKKYIDIDEDIQQMGIFGYLGEVQANILQNSAQTAAENALEGLPTKAKFPRNVLNHAYSLGISTEAVPANMNILLFLPEERVKANLDNTGRFYIDHNTEINVEGHPFHFDYDIIIRRLELPNKIVTYSAQYDMREKNPISTITNPYIKSIGRFTLSNTQVLALQTSIKQIHTESEIIDLYNSNPLQLKTFSFKITPQLVTFTIKVTEGDNVYNLEPVYDGLVSKTNSKYINYSFITEDTIRCVFKKESYQPRTHSKVTITKYTCDGTAGNFTYTTNIQATLVSETYNYNNVWAILRPLTSSVGGEDFKSIKELKSIIPIEQLSRGTITNTTDLYNFFNSINTEDRKIYFLKKLDSFERLYYAYLSLKDEYNNIIPTNTIDLDIQRQQFDAIDNYHYQLFPGNIIHYTRNGVGKVITSYKDDSEAMANYRKSGYLYTSIFNIVVNKNPFYISYLLTTFNDTYDVNFAYINQSSVIQYVCESVNWKREWFNYKDQYTLTVRLLQNTFTNLENLFSILNATGTNEAERIRLVVVMRSKDGRTQRYTYGKMTLYEPNDGLTEFEVSFKTDNTMSKTMQMKLLDMYDLRSINKAEAYFDREVYLDLYICVKLNIDYGGREELNQVVPGMVGWTCCNKYTVDSPVPLYYNYTKEISAFVNLEQGGDNKLYFYINKVPMISYDYLDSEERILEVISQLQLVRSYIEYKLETIEDGFGFDIKLFNTFGPANFFQINTGDKLDNVTLTLNFKTKPLLSANEDYLTDLTMYVKDYIENFATIISALHIPNLQADVTKAFADSVEYFEFIGFNNYDHSIQHLYREDFETKITEVPEILRIDVDSNNLPKINIEVSST